MEHFELSLEIWPGNQDAAKNLKLLKNMKNQVRLTGASR
jgi:hypothetical protein